MGVSVVKCACGKHFTARDADIRRGWGKYCSKSCKAKAQSYVHRAKQRQTYYKPNWDEDFDDAFMGFHSQDMG